MLPRPIEPTNASRTQKVRAVLLGLWSPKGLAEQVARDWPGQATGDAFVLYWRARMLTWASGSIGFAIVAVGLIASFAEYRTTTVILAGFAIVAAEAAVLHGFRLWMLFKIGGWSRRGAEPVRRTEQPMKFWIWATASSGILAILVSGAGLLLWTLIS